MVEGEGTPDRGRCLTRRFGGAERGRAYSVDVRIRVPAHRADDFKASLFRFLEDRAGEDADGFAMHHAEPEGAQVIQYVYFASDEAAVAFQRRWRLESRLRPGE